MLDKIKHAAANFCEKIGHPNISTYIMNKISPANLEKIYKIDKVITESLTIGKSVPTTIKKPTQENNLTVTKQDKQQRRSI